MRTKTNSQNRHTSFHRRRYEVNFGSNLLFILLCVNRPFRSEQQHEVDSSQRLPLTWILPFVALKAEANFAQPRANQAWVSVATVANKKCAHSDTVVVAWVAAAPLIFRSRMCAALVNATDESSRIHRSHHLPISVTVAVVRSCSRPKTCSARVHSRFAVR